MANPTYYGKYRARVVAVDDPEQRGRVRVECPSVLGDAKSAWTETCVPVAGDNEGDFCLPAVGETVWVEFEEGNVNKPVLTGGWYSQSKSPKGNYDDAPNERIISFKGTKISMRAGTCVVSTADSSVTLKNNHVIIATDGFQPPGSPPPDPVSKVKADIGKEGIAFSVDDGQVKADIKKDQIALDVGGQVEFTLSNSSITMKVMGTTCAFTVSSLTALKEKIGG